MTELTYLVQCHTCTQGKEKQVASSLFYVMHCSVLGDSKPSHGISDPFMSPRAVLKQTHTHAHREQLCLFILVWGFFCYFIHNAI